VEPRTTYASYLLRLWLVRSDDEVTWIATIDRSATGSRRSFPSVEALVTFLLAEYGRVAVAKFDGQQSQDENTVGGSSDIRGANCDQA